MNEEIGFEMKCGIVIAIFAAIMAVSDMFAGKFGEDEIKFINEKASSYMWYQSKSIKETVVEGQRDLLNTLINGQLINHESVKKLDEHAQTLSRDIEKYKKEKKEILLGSAKIGQENWIQDIDGKLGQVIGAVEYQEKIEVLGKAGDQFDFSNLFFQMCLVMGAISLVIKKEKLQLIFFYVMVSLGSIATIFSIIAYNIAQKA
jgi:hypothetical protein